MSGRHRILLRPATSEEKAVVSWLLANAATRPDAEQLLVQVESLQVVGGCGCGCPSVEFEASGQSANASVVADAHGQDAQGSYVGALVWSQDGRVSGLEVYLMGEGTECSLPRLESLQPWPAA